ncbi:trypsin-like peptidase domain-containing protein [Phenylobacterium sp.]|uniref:trypsin-like serine peptidase n=1 Tax=Phenylobacterium sp. TaxID=1871053 RepID=UPI0025D268AB|nr:trypsin-like peptidase domain-containing protein [Phenylobacterium sp.]MBX3484969.1 trypsin-like peptidase domain-containing protein [Phenylobacterium sp.]MCW5761426.1 trypsin-like peptidase domain-containing protein [Phenylobacterium sp.]
MLAANDTIDLIHATVRLEQAQGDGTATVGTGFVLVRQDKDGTPRTVLVTAQHVFARMPRDKVKVGFRRLEPDGAWRYAPANVRIRGAEGEPLWTTHPTQDVAAILIPPGPARGAIPVDRLATAQTLETLEIQPGTEMMVLGYPQGFAANDAGFPILRSGRVASFPVTPPSRYPTFLLDFTVFGGNSGGPVYVVRSVNGRPQVAITGVLTQELRLKDDRLQIGNVTHAVHVLETLSLMAGAPAAEVSPTAGALPHADPRPAAAGAAPTAWERLQEGWNDLATDVAVLFRRLWIVVRETVMGWITPEPRRT